MLDEFSPGSAEAGLRAALQSGHLSAAARAQAETLLERLAAGVCVMLLGPKGAGKSQLCNALVGQALGPAAGSVRVICDDQQVAQRFADLGPVQVTPCDGPSVFQALIVDVAAGSDGEQHAERVRRALDKADVVLWCTERFGADEARMWSGAPDALKDHSFLVLTKADLSESLGDLSGRITVLQSVVQEEFHSLFPVTTPHIQKILDAGGEVSESERAASGLKALAEALQSLVAAGQRSDLDSALLFLERHGISQNDQPETTQPPLPERSCAKGLPFKKARDAIMERALDLAELGFDHQASDLSRVLELCGAISEEVADILRSEEGHAPQIEPWRRVFEDASDKIMLMSMENDTRSAADAVTILLQLRRDLEYNSVH